MKLYEGTSAEIAQQHRRAPAGDEKANGDKVLDLLYEAFSY